MKLGSTDISKIYLGSTEVTKAYLGSVQVHGGATPLPYDAKVEYLKSSGTQYIETGYTPVMGDSIYCEFMLDTAASNTQQSLYSAGTGNYQVIHLIANGSGINGAYVKHLATGNASKMQYSPVTNTWYSLTVTPTGVSIIGSTTVTSTPTAELDGNAKTLWLWKRRNDTSPFNGKIRRFAITNNGVIKLDLIPVRVGQTGYMYDKVSGNLLGNDGTGDFVVGSDIYNSYDAEVEYLQGSGTQYIDTKTSTLYSFIGIDTYITFYSYAQDKWAAGYNSYSGGNRSGFQIGTYSNKIGVGCYNADRSISFSTTIPHDTNNHHFIVNCQNIGIAIDGNTIKSEQCNNLGAYGGNVCLFTRGGNLNSSNYRANCRIGRTRIYLYDVLLVRDFIPVRVGQVGYMYDTISGTLLGNSGTGDFTLGNDVTT